MAIPAVLSEIHKPWNPKLVANINGSVDFKVAKLQGSFIYHSHPYTDELFYILAGKMHMKLRLDSDADREEIVELAEGDVFVVPLGVTALSSRTGGDRTVDVEDVR
ncbi:hypothetical protein M501DRAFT_1015698 [Patellaria atrata CBS 101060]|uniref:Cupin type-1 domain-containing protein n=1 Tax=Patellaria atrata CBS 101060 TaxID=1346257 RepID=A0A9P4VND2_9PEZI|nr:hypothetical protein M501DRAFT_1015698 [Patellaria atrata CBS 101060]